MDGEETDVGDPLRGPIHPGLLSDDARAMQVLLRERYGGIGLIKLIREERAASGASLEQAIRTIFDRTE